MHISVTKWCIVGDDTGTFCDLWDWSINTNWLNSICQTLIINFHPLSQMTRWMNKKIVTSYWTHDFSTFPQRYKFHYLFKAGLHHSSLIRHQRIYMQFTYSPPENNMQFTYSPPENIYSSLTRHQRKYAVHLPTTRENMQLTHATRENMQFTNSPPEKICSSLTRHQRKYTVH